jgi:hypothetical protein
LERRKDNEKMKIRGSQQKGKRKKDGRGKINERYSRRKTQEGERIVERQI